MQLDRSQDFDAIIDHKEDTMRNVKWTNGLLALLMPLALTVHAEEARQDTVRRCRTRGETRDASRRRAGGKT